MEIHQKTPNLFSYRKDGNERKCLQRAILKFEIKFVRIELFILLKARESVT